MLFRHIYIIFFYIFKNKLLGLNNYLKVNLDCYSNTLLFSCILDFVSVTFYIHTYIYLNFIFGTYIMSFTVWSILHKLGKQVIKSLPDLLQVNKLTKNIYHISSENLNHEFITSYAKYRAKAHLRDRNICNFIISCGD